jgi:hypothetical protein
MGDAFVSFERHVCAENEVALEESCEAPASMEAPTPQSEALAEVRIFRAGLADALDAVRATLLRDLAVTVLARELQISPVQIDSIAAQALERVWEDEPIRVLANALDLPALGALPVPANADARLRRGDVLVEVRHGTIDVSLGARLADVLEAFS